MTATALSATKIEWKVRSATLEDKPAVEALLRASYEKLLPRDYSQDILVKALPRICGANERLLTCGTWYVVEAPSGTMLVGCGGWTADAPKAPVSNRESSSKGINMTTAMCPHLRHFATHPEYTRQGIAKALWGRTYTDVCQHFQTHVPPAMEVFSTRTAIPYYQSLGFERVQDIDIPLAEDCLFPSILMKRPPES